MNKLINSIISPLRRFSCLSPHRKMTALATAAFVLAAGIMIPQVAGTLAAPPSGATTLNVSAGWIEFTATQAIQHSFGTATVISSTALNPQGYVLTGTASITGTNPIIMGNGNANVKVDPGVTITLYLNNVNISSGAASGILTTGADVTIVLVDGTTNNFVASIYGGCIVKNGMDSHKLTIQCEHADEPGHICNSGCGTLNCTGTLNADGVTYVAHSAAIGSSVGIGGVGQGWNNTMAANLANNGGFSNLYIRGGNIIARAGAHSPGIGSMCGTTYNYNGGSNVNTPQCLAAYGNGGVAQICKNINITGGNVKAYGGDSCAGIGSGWGGQVDGIYINGSAYVHAEGGINSPGIGSGGCGQSAPYPIQPGCFNVSNIIISGGPTVVEAVGSNTVKFNLNAANGPTPTTGPTMVPGIGVGVDGTLRLTGTVTNVQAQPLSGWYACVKQGTSLATATYVTGSPSAANMDIATTNYYNLVRFTQALTKTASVNGGSEITGTARDPVMVQIGDSIRYTLAASATDTTTYSVSDAIPAGLTLSAAAGSYSPGMTTSVSGGVTTVVWSGLTGDQTVFFTVAVDSANSTGVYINKAVKDEGGGITFTSNATYHKPYCTLYIRQVVLSPNGAVQQPDMGYFRVADSAKNTYPLTGISQTDVASPDQAYTKYLLLAAGTYNLTATIPQYYKYVGYWSSADNGNYTSAAGIDKAGNTLTFSDTAKTLYVTVYITPTTNFITNYQWSIATNNVGTINP